MRPQMRIPRFVFTLAFLMIILMLNWRPHRCAFINHSTADLSEIRAHMSEPSLPKTHGLPPDPLLRESHDGHLRLTHGSAA